MGEGGKCGCSAQVDDDPARSTLEEPLVNEL